MCTLAVLVFEVLERAWAAQNCTLVDMKVEFGFDSATDRVLLADVVDNDAWRVWPQGDKRLMQDKQFYRELTEVTSEALAEVLKKYEWVADAVRRFQEVGNVAAYTLTEDGAYTGAEYTPAVCCEEGACEEETCERSDLPDFLPLIANSLEMLNIPMKLVSFTPEVRLERSGEVVRGSSCTLACAVPPRDTVTTHPKIPQNLNKLRRDLDILAQHGPGCVIANSETSFGQ
jgi:hypothetical protein